MALVTVLSSALKILLLDVGIGVVVGLDPISLGFFAYSMKTCVSVHVKSFVTNLLSQF